MAQNELTGNVEVGGGVEIMKYYRITVSPEGVNLRVYHYDPAESELHDTPTYRADEPELRYLRPKDVKIGEMKNRSIVCAEAGIPDAIRLLYAHFTEQYTRKKSELQEVADKVEHLKRFMADYNKTEG